jgi:tetratricopeptide (TPR) repeat protein
MGTFPGRRFPVLVLALACLIFYGNTLKNDYAYDDAVVITENTFTQQGIAGLPALFTHHTFAGSYGNTPTLARYRPLSVATFALEHQLFGPRPALSHLFNLLLFFLDALLLYALVAKVFGGGDGGKPRFDLPLVTALLFVIHPVHTEVVANLKGRDELLVLAGGLSALLCLLRYHDTRRPRDLGGAFVLFLLALFAKENAITFLAIAPLTLHYYKPGDRRTTLRALVPLALASLVFLGAMAGALRGASPPPADLLTDPFAHATVAERLATACYTLLIYLRLLVFPHPLTIDYSPYQLGLVTFAHPLVWLSLLIHAGLAAYALAKVRGRSLVAYGILFYAFALSVVANLFFSVGTFLSERFLFLPSVGFVLIVAWLLCTRLFPVFRPARVVLLALGLLCLVKTYARNEDWKNDFTLFTADVAVSPDSLKANLAAAVALLEEAPKVPDAAVATGYRARALHHVEHAVALYEKHTPDHARGAFYDHALTLLGDAYHANGQDAEALSRYQRVIAHSPDRERLGAMVEAILDESSDVDFKIQQYTAFARLVPDNFLFNYRLGYLYGRARNDLPQSIHFLEKAVALQPDQVHALVALSHAHKLAQHYARAAALLEKATQLRPGDPTYLARLLSVYQLAGDEEKANQVEQRLRQLSP